MAGYYAGPAADRSSFTASGLRRRLWDLGEIPGVDRRRHEFRLHELLHPFGDLAVIIGLLDRRVDVVAHRRVPLAHADAAKSDLVELADEIRVLVLLGDADQEREVMRKAVGALLQQCLQAVRDVLE